MLPHFRSTFVLLLFAPALACAATSLDHARRARALVGEDTWARVIQVENTNPRSFYPRSFHALVFELGGLLWFYTHLDGTQSFSLHRNNLRAEKADFAPLLRDIDPGFAAHTLLRDEPVEPTGDAAAEGALPNGCFIESFAALRERAAAGELILEARLLSYYARGHRAGHTVLAYETPRGVFVLDASAAGKPVKLERAQFTDAVEIARRLKPKLPIVHARWVPMVAGPERQLVAAVDDSRKRRTEATALQ